MTYVRLALLMPLLMLLLGPGLGGCTNFGPRAVQAGRADYNQVLRDTADEQMLANLVRLRYRDRPFYLEVSAVTTQFTFSPQLSATAALGSPQVEQDLLVGALGIYSEQPTVSYAPLQGDEFARRLLAPLALDSLVLLSHSGWSAERLLRVCVQRINGIPNAVNASGPTPDATPEYGRFLELARAVRRLQVQDALTIGFRADSQGQGEAPVVMFTKDALDTAEYRTLTDILKLEPGRREYRVVSALRGGGGDTIGLQTRSLNGMLYYLAQSVQVPDVHLRGGLVNVTRHPDGQEFDWGLLTSGLMAVRASSDFPRQAAVRVRYRDHWYFIDDADLDSKATFSLLAQLFALQAGGGEGVRPVLTLPVGG